MKIVLLQRVLTRYREPVFETLQRQANQRGYEFEVWVSKPGREFGERGTTGELPSWVRVLQVTPILWLSGLEWQSLPWREVLACDVMIVPDTTRILSNSFVLFLRRLAGKPVLTWGHGTNFQQDGVSRFCAAFRYRLLRLAHGHLVYSDICVAPLVAAGFDRTRIAVTENALDTSDAAGLHPEHAEVLEFRKNHGLDKDPCVTFLGSWYKRKRPELIVRIGEAIRHQVPNARMLVIGGGDGLTVTQERELTWVTCLGPLHGRDKYVALSTARCLAVTGVAGLNLLDAMAAGLPVVVPKRDDHSPEIAYVQDGENGRLVSDEVQAIADSCVEFLRDNDMQARMAINARQTSRASTVDRMAENMLDAALAVANKPLKRGVRDQQTVVFIYQRMLPYHQARFTALSKALGLQGKLCIAIEVAAIDRSYGAIHNPGLTNSGAGQSHEARICLFPGVDYLDLKPRQVAGAVYQVLQSLKPSVIFSPAPAFAEGAGALHYRARFSTKLILMDDTWSGTDQRGQLTRMIKRLFYSHMDGGFFPSPMHGNYFSSLNIPLERQAYPVDVVGDLADTTYAGTAESAKPYFLFVGRLIRRKGLGTLLRALNALQHPDIPLLIIGDGPERDRLQNLAESLGVGGRVQWLGRKTNLETRQYMRNALALLVPSDFEQWGLVVNEAWAAGLPLLGSETVGALRATTPAERRWTLLPPNDAQAWQTVLARFLRLTAEEHNQLAEAGLNLAKQFSLGKHVDGALRLIDLPPRRKPLPPIGWVACRWHGRVAVW